MCPLPLLHIPYLPLSVVILPHFCSCLNAFEWRHPLVNLRFWLSLSFLLLLFLISVPPELTQYTTQSHHHHRLLLPWEPINNSECRDIYAQFFPVIDLSYMENGAIHQRPITRRKWQIQGYNPQLVCNSFSLEALGLAEVVYFVERHLKCTAIEGI